MRRRTMLAGLAGLPLLSGCEWLGFKEWEWRQRLTLEVETPSGLVSGGSVVAVKAGATPKWAPGQGAGGMGASLRGEASFVEVAPGRYLFALLGERTKSLGFFLFFPPGMADSEAKARALEGMRATVEMPRERYPLLVTFTDITDPKTVRRVDPQNLAASFGPGVALKRITLEITDEKMSEGEVEKVLGWLDEYYDKRLDGQRYGTIHAENRLANDLSAGAFDTVR